MSEDPAERLRGIATRMRNLSRTIRSAQNPAARHTGEDATGMVTVTTDGSGRVSSVDISRGWFSCRGTTSLGPAILEAHQAAITKILTEQTDRLEQSSGELYDSHSDEASWRAEPPAARRAPTFADLDDLRRSLADAENRHSGRVRQTPASPAQRRVHGPAGHISLLVRDHAVQSVSVGAHIDPGLLAALSRDAVTAFREAHSPATGESPAGNSDERHPDA